MSDTELLPKSKPEPSEPVRRLEVFTGTGRRRPWTAEQKARIVAESLDGVGPVSAVARRHGLTPQQLFCWRRLARRAGNDKVDDTNGVAFAPVVVEPAARSANTPDRGGSMIEVVIGAATVRVPRGIDGATLTTVLRAVRAAT